MSVSAADFQVANATELDRGRLEKAIQYLQQSEVGTIFLELAAEAGVRIGINSWGTDRYGENNTPGQTSFDHDDTGMILWNPMAALQIRDNDKVIVGVQSAALGLLHEIVHAVDPGLVANFASRIPKYGFLNEFTAIQYETMVANELGEVTRENHWGVDILSLDPTTHTMPTEDGGLVWAQMGKDGREEYGPVYEPQPQGDPDNQVPVFGSADPGGAYHDGDDSGDGNWPNDGGNGAGEYPGNEHDNDSPPGSYDGGGRPSGHDDGDPYDGDGWPSEHDPGADGGGNNGGGNNGGGWDGTSDPYDDGPGYDGGYDGGYGGGYDGGYDGGGGYGDYGGDYGGGGGGGGGFGCVAVSSFLPDGRTAGDIKVGDTMELGDQETMEPGTGVVSYSQTKEARGYRIVTESGVSLVCSDTAPIPARRKGLLTPDKLLGEQVAVRRGEGGQSEGGWETVTGVDEVGIIKVQHVTVGNKCFLAGEKKGAYILHHNVKDAGGGDDCWPDDDWIPFRLDPKVDESQQTAQRGDHGEEPTQLVGVSPPPVVDGISFL